MPSFTDCLAVGPQLDEETIRKKADQLFDGSDFARPTDLRPKLARESEKLLEKGIPATDIAKVITATAERALRSGIAEAIREFGPPPVSWMFMLMGSEGRVEQTLRTDQDSAIVYDEGDHHAYFNRLGTHIAEGLNGFGFLFCKGGVMASNPKWVMSLKNWKKAFSRWVEEPEPMAIMQACIFFDLRCGYGDAEKEQALKEHIHGLLGGRSGLFFFHMAQNALKHSVPLGMFGGIKWKNHNRLDIKKAMLPIVDHARIYALKHGIPHGNTQHRILKLKEMNQYKGAKASEALAAFEFMTTLRLRHQITQLHDARSPDNDIDPSKLEKPLRKDLIRCLKLSRDLQQNIELNFRAGY